MTRLPAAQRQKMSVAAIRAYAEGRHTRTPKWTPEGRANRIAAALVRIYTFVECPLCGETISSLQMNRHQKGKRCDRLREGKLCP